MVSTRKKTQSNGRVLSQSDDYNQDNIIGIAMSDRQGNTTFNEGTPDQEFTVGNCDSNPTVSENVVNVNTFENCFTKKIDRETGNIDDTVEDMIRDAILIAIDKTITPKIELAITSINASSGRDATSGMANSERGEHMDITPLL